MKNKLLIGIVQPTLRQSSSSSSPLPPSSSTEEAEFTTNTGEDGKTEEDEEQQQQTQHESDEWALDHHHALVVEAQRIANMILNRDDRHYRTTTTSTAVASDIDLFVLPELCPVGYMDETFHQYLPSTKRLRKVYRDVDRIMSRTAQQSHAYICYGTIGWTSSPIHNSNSDNISDDDDDDSDGNDENKNDCGDVEYFIRQKVVNRDGTLVAQYDKTYLCDYGDCNETVYFISGGRGGSSSKNIVTFDIVEGENDRSENEHDSKHNKCNNNWRIGIQICADIRHAMLSRNILLHGLIVQEQHQDSQQQQQPQQHDVLHDGTTHVILQPSCFSRDVSFRTWASFRETRAIENGVYWIGVNYAGTYYGESSCTPPWVDDSGCPTNQPVVVGTDPGVFVVELSKDVIRSARQDMPRYFQSIIHECIAEMQVNT